MESDYYCMLTSGAVRVHVQRCHCTCAALVITLRYQHAQVQQHSNSTLLISSLTSASRTCTVPERPRSRAFISCGRRERMKPCLLLLLALVLQTSGLANSVDVSVVVFADTALEVNGTSEVAKVFGLSAYGGPRDFTNDLGVTVLRRFRVDSVGLGQTLGHVLPQVANTSLNTSAALAAWLSSPAAKELYERTSQYQILKSRVMWKGGARPFIFLKNPDGNCTPAVEAEECLAHGTPISLDSPVHFGWWAELFTGYLQFCLAADPGIDTVHIWNEPNTHFYHDGKNGSYYAQFFVEVATALKARWPALKIGGPVTWDPPDGPFNVQPNHFVNWATYAKPLIDAASPKKLIDFVDFHAYDANADPESLLSAIQLAQVYPAVIHGHSLPIAITESNYKIDGPSSRQVHYYNRTFPLLLSTLALMRHPDRLVTRLFYDYKSNGRHLCSCAFVSGPPDNLTITPTAELYSLLGMLANGTRVAVSVEGTEAPCTCQSTRALGNTSVLVEAALVESNLTVSLTNPCNCSLTTSLQVKGLGAVSDAWAAVLDVHSLREVAPPSMDGDVKLPPLSLLLSTYTLKDCSNGRCSPVEALRETTVLPTSGEWVMKEIPVNIPCDFHVAVMFNVSEVVPSTTQSAALRLSVLGDPGLEVWRLEGNCTAQLFEIEIDQPGVFIEVTLPCIPIAVNGGLTTVHLTTVSCKRFQEARFSKQDPTPIAYFSSVVLVYTSVVSKLVHVTL